MDVITALGNEKIAEEIKKKTTVNIVGTDIQYKEAVIDILEKNEKINILILNSLLPGELNIYEFINLIKYKNSEIEIIIFLEKEDMDLKKFIISKGIKYIYYNNKITVEEIIKILNNYENKKIELKINEKNNKIKNKYLKIKNTIIKKINKNKKNNINKIISIIGAPKVGKSIFIIIFSLLIKNKKILIINLNKNNNIKILIGKKYKKINNNVIKYKKNVDILYYQEEKYYKKINYIIDNLKEKYDYIFMEIDDVIENKEFILKSNLNIVLIEANLLGIKESKDILEKLIIKQNIQKDNIKIIFNKHCITSIKSQILKIMYEDFEILGVIQYDKYYNFLINFNFKYINKKIKNNYLKIIKKII